MSEMIRPYKVEIPQDEVDRLKRRLAETRVPTKPIVPDAGEDYGPSFAWIERLYKKWLEFDWYKVQTHINRNPHFIASIEDDGAILNIHFVHTKSPRPDAIPLVMIHGWPGSFHEFDKVCDELANPANSSDPAFHVVAPSLPGFCWSSPPHRRKWTLQDSARVLNKLMVQLGYKSYCAQAGDWGSFVAREMGARFRECKGVHLNFCPTPKPDELTEPKMTDRHKRVETRCQEWLDDHLGYAVLMRTRPQTVGWMLADNPVGILVWVGEKYNELAWPEYQARHQAEWDDVILTTCSLYYFSNCAMTSSLLYYENVKHAEFGKFFLRPENRIEVPFGYTSFFYDSRPSYKEAVEKTGNLLLYNGEYDTNMSDLHAKTGAECDQGGHFAALERPDVLIQDCRTLFGQHFQP